MRRNCNENGRWAEFPGSNTHSSGDISSRSSFRAQTVNCCTDHLSYAFFSLLQLFITDLGLLSFEVPLSHTIRNTHTHTYPLAFLWTSDQLVAEPATQTTDYIQKRPKSLPLAKFEPAILAIELPQIYVLDRTATGIGHILCMGLKIDIEDYMFLIIDHTTVTKNPASHEHYSVFTKPLYLLP